MPQSSRQKAMLSRELTAATAKPAVLAILAEGESYGYEILRRVREISGGRIEWAEGALYPMLHRLEKQGYIESFWVQPESGRRRKYYRLLPKGERENDAERRQWKLADALLRELWNPEPSLGLQ